MAVTTGKFFEDFEVGWKYVTAARTITETDIVHFAGISGDYNAVHTDEEFNRSMELGGRFAHGVLTLAILTGLNDRAGVFEGTILAFMGMNHLSFKKYVRPGDTIHADVEVLSKRESRKPGRGIVTSRFRGVNQDGEVVMDSEIVVMMRMREAGLR